MFDRELRKGTTPFLILAMLEIEPRHGYEISRRIEEQSRGVLRVHAASLYPLLYRLEKRGWIVGRWVEKPGERRRRHYRLTARGRGALEKQREQWMEFATAVTRITGVAHA
jgi:transcriptional regulator